MNPASIDPFTISIDQSALDHLGRRLADTRWPVSPAGGWERGVELGYLRELTEYWTRSYDWRAAEAEINAFPQFTTEIDGANVHFLHIRSSEPAARPLVLIHGWPGSIVEFLDLIGPLTDPVAHGGDAADAFHVVIPSLPNFGFSGPTPDTGWGSRRVAAAFAELMHRLGYDRYLAQGGDMGALVAPDLGRVDPDGVLGVHVNAATFGFIPMGPVDDDERAALSPGELTRLERMEHFLQTGFGYAQLMSTKPNTIGFALQDSPVGLLAFMVEKFREWTHPSDALPEVSIDRDRMLTCVMLYWLTGTAASAAQMYYENMHSGQWPTRSAIPTWVSAFAEDVSIRRWSESLNTIAGWTDHDRGGHFAALEAPDLLIGDIRTAFRSLR